MTGKSNYVIATLTDQLIISHQFFSQRKPKPKAIAHCTHDFPPSYKYL